MKPVSQRVLQDYLEALAGERGAPDRAEEMLTSYAEVRYRINGGGRCSMCNAHVRHVLPVMVTHADGTDKQYECLCHRCLQGEKAIAVSIDIKLGRAHWVIKKSQAAKPKKPRAAKAG